MARIGDVGWIPRVGDFEVAADAIRFRGTVPQAPPDDQPKPKREEPRTAFGLLISNRSIADGTVSATVEFDEVTDESICELVVAYDANARHIVTTGLGSAQWALYGIREFGGPRATDSWWSHSSGGERAALHPKTTYQLEARFLGATVSLLIDGVLIASEEVTSPRGRPRQVGLLCRGNHLITVRDFNSQAVKPRAFVVMQFGGEYEAVYRDVIQEVCGGYEVTVRRADEVSGPGLVIGDIVREINEAQLVIADITPTNANVYFEVGYAMALGKPTILLAKKDTKLPFDVAGFRVLFYEDTIGGKNKLEEGLRRHLAAILET